MGSFSTSDSHAKRWHQPVKVPQAKEGIYGSAKELVEDLDGWTLERADDDALELHVKKSNGPLGGASVITIRVTGPDGIPSSETNVTSTSTGAVFSRDKANVATFCEKFWMRVT